MSDDEIRAFLQRNPDVLRSFLGRESRQRARWLLDWLDREQRIGSMQIDVLLRH